MDDPEALVERMKEVLKKRGAEGIRGLGRNFMVRLNTVVASCEHFPALVNIIADNNFNHVDLRHR